MSFVQRTQEVSLLQRTQEVSIVQRTQEVSIVQRTQGVSFVQRTQGVSLVQRTQGVSLVQRTQGVSLVQRTYMRSAPCIENTGSIYISMYILSLFPEGWREEGDWSTLTHHNSSLAVVTISSRACLKAAITTVGCIFCAKNCSETPSTSPAEKQTRINNEHTIQSTFHKIKWNSIHYHRHKTIIQQFYNVKALATDAILVKTWTLDSMTHKIHSLSVFYVILPSCPCLNH